jgi:hypothetical protein
MPWGAQVPTSSWAGNPVACFKATATSNRNFGGGLERRGCIPLVTSGGKKNMKSGEIINEWENRNLDKRNTIWLFNIAMEKSQP